MIGMPNEGKVWQDKQTNGYSELYNCNSKEIIHVSASESEMRYACIFSFYSVGGILWQLE